MLKSFIYTALSTVSDYVDYTEYDNVIIENSVFDEISSVDSIFYHNDQVAFCTFYILNSHFGNINLGSILHTFSGINIVYISNVTISTAQTIQDDTVATDYALFISEEERDTINMNNITIQYLYADYMLQHCDTTVTLEDYIKNLWELYNDINVDVGFWWFSIFCSEPMQFLYSVSTTNMNNINVMNDITDETTKSFTDSILSEIYSISYNPHDTIYIDIFFENNDEWHSFIYNEGPLNIQTMNVFGYGAHHTMIYSTVGDVTISNLNAYPDTYCIDNTECRYDADALGISVWIIFGVDSNACGYTLNVTDSNIYGMKYAAIVAYSGYVYLKNVEIEMGSHGVFAKPEVSYFEMKSSTMKNVGNYYASHSYSLDALNSLWPSFRFLAYEVLIEDTLFSFVDAYQFSMFGSYENTVHRQISLLNNVFEINDQHILVEPYPFNQSYAIIDEWIQSVLFENQHKTFDLNVYFVDDGILPFQQINADIILINTKFKVHENNSYVTESILSQLNIPWIYIENSAESTTTICISGNQFTNYAIHVQNGSLTSCVKPQLNNFFDVGNFDEYGTFGSFDVNAMEYNQHQENVFNITDIGSHFIFNAEYGSFIALDNNVINIVDFAFDSYMFTLQHGNYLLVDTKINTLYHHDIEIDDGCAVKQYVTVDNISEYISILHVMCNHIATTNHTLSIFKEHIANISSHWSPYSIEMVPESGIYFAGNALKFNYYIFDFYNNPILHPIYQELTVTVYSASNNDSFYANVELYIDESGICLTCVNGIFFSTITTNLINNTYTLVMEESNHYLLVNNEVDIKIVQCPPGYGATDTSQCNICNIGYFNLLPTVDACHYCNDDDLDGVKCLGYNNIVIDYNYWIVVDQYSANIDDSVFESNNIISNQCAPKYCCQLDNGCDFVNDQEFLCAKYRNSSVFLCGQCVHQYSEVFGTTQCMLCDRTYWERFLFPIIYGFVWALFILYTKSKNLNDLNDDKCCYVDCCTQNKSTDFRRNALTRKEYLNSLEIMMTKNMLYYYQSISYILSTSGIQTKLLFFANIFNLDIYNVLPMNEHNEPGYCLIENMTMIQKIVIPILSTASILFSIFLSFVLLSCCHKNVFSPCNREPIFVQAFVKAMLVSIGQVLSILFQLMACKNIADNTSVHYLFGSHQCFGLIWKLSLLFLLLIVIVFLALIFVVCIKRKPKDPENVDKFYYPITWCYREECFWWELILFLRRLLLSLIFIVVGNVPLLDLTHNDLKMYVAILLVLLLFIHQKCEPFQLEDVNVFESYLIAALSIIVFVDVSYTDSESKHGDAAISILILFPFFWFSYFMISRRKYLKNTEQNAGREMIDPGDSFELPTNQTHLQLVTTNTISIQNDSVIFHLNL